MAQTNFKNEYPAFSEQIKPFSQKIKELFQPRFVSPLAGYQPEARTFGEKVKGLFTSTVAKAKDDWFGNVNKLQSPLASGSLFKPYIPPSPKPVLGVSTATKAPTPTPTNLFANTPTKSPTATPIPAGSATIPGFIRTGARASYYDLINQEATKNGLDPSLLAALLFQESGIQPDSINSQDIYNDKGVLLKKGARDRGIAQINDYWNPQVTDAQAFDPNFAIPWAAKTIADNIKHFSDINRGVAAYNVGLGGASVKGPEPFGGGPRGQAYLDALAQNLTPEQRKKLGIITTYDKKPVANK